MERVEDLFVGDYQVPSLPEIYFKVKETLENPDSTHTDMAAIISQDPGLSIRLLKIVNSAFFGFSDKIDTITHAAGIIGMEQLNSLVISTVVVEQFKGLQSKFISMRGFWEHSVLCGLTAKMLAAEHEEDNLEHYFVAGLLHDVGRLILCMAVPDKVEKAFKLSTEKNLYMHQAERTVIGFDHCGVGAYIMEKWNLPLIHQQVAGYHHSPGVADCNLEASIVHVADFVANNSGFGNGGETFVPPINSRAMELVGVKRDHLMGPFLQKALVEFAGAGEAFLQAV